MNNTDSKILIVKSFLEDISKKYKTDIDKIMVGVVSNELHIWRYDEGANEVFKQLEIIELDN